MSWGCSQTVLEVSRTGHRGGLAVIRPEHRTNASGGLAGKVRRNRALWIDKCLSHVNLDFGPPDAPLLGYVGDLVLHGLANLPESQHALRGSLGQVFEFLGRSAKAVH
jgi:hypothetical protein